MGLKSPGQGEVIRACQRDNEFIKRLKQDIDEMVLEVFGQRVWLRFQEYSKQTSSLIYYALTSLLGSQTLGEEYVGVIQVDKSYRSIPSKKAISLMIFAEAFGTPFINYVLQMIENFNERRKRTNSMSKYLATLIKLLLGVGYLYQSFSPLLTQLHLAIFYMNGQFYQFSKRWSGIRYALVRQYFGNEDEISKRNLKYLMWMSVLNLAVTASHDSYRFISDTMKKHSKSEGLIPSHQGNDEHRTPSSSDVNPALKCSLCLEVRRYSSVTPCGHLFCWDCIMDWLRSEAACPMCRELVSPSRIVPLQNFS